MTVVDRPPTADTGSTVAAAALVSVVLWASAFVAIRYAGRQVGPGELALGRLAVGSVALGIAMLVSRERVPRGRALGYAALSGLLWFGVYNVALNAAEQRIDSGSAALLVNTGPLFLLVLAGLFLHEGFPRRLVGGSVISFAGVVLIGGAVSGHGVAATWAAALCLLAALAYALGLIAQKPALRGASPLAITWTACTVAAIACLPWAPALVDQSRHAHLSDLLWIVYLGLGPTAIGFGCWTFALSKSSAGRLGILTYLVPPLTVLLGWILLSETPPLLALPGGILCLVGIALSRGRASSRAASTISRIASSALRWWPRRMASATRS